MSRREISKWPVQSRKKRKENSTNTVLITAQLHDYMLHVLVYFHVCRNSAYFAKFLSTEFEFCTIGNFYYAHWPLHYVHLFNCSPIQISNQSHGIGASRHVNTSNQASELDGHGRWCQTGWFEYLRKPPRYMEQKNKKSSELEFSGWQKQS